MVSLVELCLTFRGLQMNHDSAKSKLMNSVDLYAWLFVSGVSLAIASVMRMTDGLCLAWIGGAILVMASSVRFGSATPSVFVALFVAFLIAEVAGSAPGVVQVSDGRLATLVVTAIFFGNSLSKAFSSRDTPPA